MKVLGSLSQSFEFGRSLLRYRYQDCLFVLGHMRSGSTALSNILCSRPDVSGYGEAHVNHNKRLALRRLAVNQLRRDSWRPNTNCLFDKILHSRLDDHAPDEFFRARVIFLVRTPTDSISSIVKLFAQIGKAEYQTHEEAAEYYVDRLAMLEQHWHRFAANRRIGLLHEQLIRDPDQALDAISARLGISPPLENRYVSSAASRRGGGGDPLVSGKYNRIEPAEPRPPLPQDSLEISSTLMEQAQKRYEALKLLFTSG